MQNDLMIARDLGTQLIMSYCLQLRLQQSSEAIYVKFAKPCNKQKGELFSVSKSEKRFSIGFYPFQGG